MNYRRLIQRPIAIAFEEVDNKLEISKKDTKANDEGIAYRVTQMARAKITFNIGVNSKGESGILVNVSAPALEAATGIDANIDLEFGDVTSKEADGILELYIEKTITYESDNWINRDARIDEETATEPVVDEGG